MLIGIINYRTHLLPRVSKPSSHVAGEGKGCGPPEWKLSHVSEAAEEDTKGPPHTPGSHDAQQIRIFERQTIVWRPWNELVAFRSCFILQLYPKHQRGVLSSGLAARGAVLVLV